MAQTAKRLIDGAQMTGAPTTYFTATATTVVKRLLLCNTTIGAVACTVYLVPSADVAGAANTIISSRQVTAGETLICPEAENMVLEIGGTIQAKGSNVSILASGIEIT